VIVGLFLQQTIALFVLKTKAGFDIFTWIARFAADFLEQSHAGAVFFFEESVTRWFFIGVVSSRVTSSGAICLRATYPACCGHLFHCIRSDDVLFGCHAMGHRQIVWYLYAHVYCCLNYMCLQRVALLQNHGRIRC